MLPLITCSAYKLFLSQVFITWGLTTEMPKPPAHRHGYASECVGKLICTKAVIIFQTEIMPWDFKGPLKILYNLKNQIQIRK